MNEKQRMLKAHKTELSYFYKESEQSHVINFDEKVKTKPSRATDFLALI